MGIHIAAFCLFYLENSLILHFRVFSGIPKAQSVLSHVVSALYSTFSCWWLFLNHWLSILVHHTISLNHSTTLPYVFQVLSQSCTHSSLQAPALGICIFLLSSPSHPNSLHFFHRWWWFGGLVTKSCPTLATPWTVACQALLSMGFSRQEHWSGLPFPSPGNLPDPGTEPGSSALQADSLPTELWVKPSSVGNYCYS